MPDSLAPHREPFRPPGTSVPDAADDETLGELRTLLVGPDLQELRAFRARFADPASRARDVGTVLADAVAQRAHDPELARALAPPVEQAITASVRRDPQPLADALFPAIGPAIRMAIAHTLSSMMDSLNRTIEQSLSWRALQWRWTAVRTGKPFAEIVLLHTLQYRVEQVFLVHRETGLLLQHVAHDPRAGQDAAQVSAMLTAISDFVRDSFSVSASDRVEALRVGDLAVIVEQGPHALLACVVRGTPPAELREIIQEALERVHRRLGTELEAFGGDTSGFEPARPILESCLISHFRPTPQARSARWWRLAGGVLIALTAVWIFATMRASARWTGYLDRLEAEPGLTVVNSGRRDGRYFVAGLRDPLAADPATLLAASGLEPDAVEQQWEPYQALEPGFVAARAADLLRPPSSVTLSFRDGVLVASGTAPERWIAESARLAPAIAGVRTFAFDGPRDDERLAARLEASTVRFVRGRAAPAPGQEAAIAELVTTLRDLSESLAARGRRAVVEVVGHTDSDGSETTNDALSRARAGWLISQLPAGALPALDVRAVGAGSTEPLVRGETEGEKQLNRRLSFRVRASAPAAGRRP